MQRVTRARLSSYAVYVTSRLCAFFTNPTIVFSADSMAAGNGDRLGLGGETQRQQQPVTLQIMYGKDYIRATVFALPGSGSAVGIPRGMAEVHRAKRPQDLPQRATRRSENATDCFVELVVGLCCSVAVLCEYYQGCLKQLQLDGNFAH